MKKFDASYADEDKRIRRAQHGKPWSEHEYKALRQLYVDGATLAQMCCTLERPAAGILPKLCDERLIRALDYWTYAEVAPRRTPFGFASLPVPISPTIEAPRAEETTMSEKTIETLVLIQGQNAAELNDKQIFALIGKLENEAKRMGEITNKPKKLVAAIEQIQADIAKLVEYVDTREVQ
jgi:hypothetical protein